jgi:hypothetical protein
MVLVVLLLNWSELSIRRTVLLYKQFIRPIMDYACPAWRSTAGTNVRRLQVLQSKGIHLITGALLCLRNRQIHEYLGVPLLTDHLRSMTASLIES